MAKIVHAPARQPAQVKAQTFHARTGISAKSAAWIFVILSEGTE